MVTKCVIDTCNTIKAGDGVTLHGLPTDSKIQQEWFRAILKETGQTVFSEDDVICSKHFSSDCFTVIGKEVILKPTAIPFESVKSDGPRPKRIKRDKGSKPECSVFSCENTLIMTEAVRPQLTYHRFPKDPQLVEKWKLFCNNADSNFEHSYVCSDHFDDNDYVTKRGAAKTKTLKPGAVPTIYKREKTIEEHAEVDASLNASLDSSTVSPGDTHAPSTISEGSADLGADESEILEDCADHYARGVRDERKNKSGILNGTYFKVVNRDIVSRKIEAQCMKCVSHVKIVKGCINVTTNFLKHLKKTHPEEYMDYLKKKGHPINQPASTIIDKPKLNVIFIPTNNQIASTSIDKPKIKLTSIPQNAFDTKLLAFLIDTMTPVDIIEQPSFITLFEGTNYDIMNKEIALEKIREMYDVNVQRIIGLLNNASHVCTTVDIWTLKYQNFLGVTCHWINKDFQRQSVVLSCRRFSGPQKQILVLLEDIYSTFKLNAQKIITTVTDNGTNFLKFFRKYGISIIFPDDLSDNSGDNSEGDIEESPLPNFVEILGDDDPEQLSSSDLHLTNIHLALPNHVKCFTSTLNLIITQEITKAINEDASLSSRHKYILSKCNELWRKAKISKSAKMIKSLTDHSLTLPDPTSWSSLYNAIKSILLVKNHIPTLCKSFDIKNTFTHSDIVYLEEYCRVLAPFASLLQLLQGEQNSFSGYILPSLITLKVKYDKMRSACTLKYASSLLNACIDVLNEKYLPYFKLSSEVNEAIIAAATLPIFKLRWLNGIKDEISVSLKDIQELIVKAEEDENNGLECDNESVADTTAMPETSDFFDFNESNVSVDSRNVSNSRQFAFELELLKYLDDKRTNLDMLNDYPKIKKLFFKYNTRIASSAPVERLFPFKSMTTVSTKTYFEQFVVLKANQ